MQTAVKAVEAIRIPYHCAAGCCGKQLRNDLFPLSFALFRQHYNDPRAIDTGVFYMIEKNIEAAKAAHAVVRIDHEEELCFFILRSECRPLLFVCVFTASSQQ